MIKFSIPSLSPVRRWLARGAAGLACGLALSAAAHAGEAGRIVLVHGSAQVGERKLALGDAISEGDVVATGKDGYVYLRTVDNGLLILRPSSRARIVAYHVDHANPANTRIKLELLSGVARSVSGQAVKLARQNFRFNTPVAAIGVRGTDFTVYTDNQTSRVTVLSGGIVVSGFTGSCSPEGAGPCEHAVSRELSAAQTGQMLEVARDKAVPQLMTASPALAPDAVAPPRSDEPVAKEGGPLPTPALVEASLDPRKNTDILNHSVVNNRPLPDNSMPQPVVEPAPVTPVGKLAWGRWQAIASSPATVDTTKLLKEGGKRMAQLGHFTVLRTAGAFAAPNNGEIGFRLTGSDAVVMNPATNQVSNASLENGKLNVDFGKQEFTTSFDLLTGGEKFNMRAVGVVGADGNMSGNSTFLQTTNMNVNGSLSNENGMSAAYVFQGRLDATRVANGVTSWQKQ